MRTAIRRMARLKIVCSKMYSRGIPKALHGLRDLWKLFVTVSLILLVRTVRDEVNG